MPGAPTSKLLAITSALNRDLTQLLSIVTSRDEERDQLRHELQKSRDQLANLLVLPTSRNHLSATTASTSRPLSHVSLSDCEAAVDVEESEQSEETPASPETDCHQQATSGGEYEAVNEGNESQLVDPSIASVESDSLQTVAPPDDEKDITVNNNKTTDDNIIGAIVLGEKTDSDVPESSEA